MTAETGPPPEALKTKKGSRLFSDPDVEGAEHAGTADFTALFIDDNNAGPVAGMGWERLRPFFPDLTPHAKADFIGKVMPIFSNADPCFVIRNAPINAQNGPVQHNGFYGRAQFSTAEIGGGFYGAGNGCRRFYILMCGF